MTGAPIPAGATAIVPVEATDGGTDVVRITAPSAEGQLHPPRRRGRRRRRHGAAGRAGGHTGGGRPGRGAGSARAAGDSAAARAGRCPPDQSWSRRERRCGRGRFTSPIRRCWPPRSATPAPRWSPPLIASDDVGEFTALLDRYAAESDLIITSGGVSAGAYEVVKDAFGRAGDQGVEFVKVAMQPGMPQGTGRVAGTPIVTLPGNPVSALGVFRGVHPAGAALRDGPADSASAATDRPC